jgi:nucleotide sugar dehydrogenase
VVSGGRSDGGPPIAYNLIPRVVGGINPRSARLARRVYETFLDSPIHLVRTPEVAEATKLLENIFRDVNIALINELAAALDALGVDTYEVITAASTKGFAFLAHHPGLVGGECIPVDTWYLVRQAERLGVDCALMHTARRVNDGLVQRVAGMACDLLMSAGVEPQGAKVAILGTAYKANVHDDRVSPARRLASVLADRGLRPFLCDPLVKQQNHRTRDQLVDLEKALDGASAAILVTDHDLFCRLEPEWVGSLMRHRLVVDVRNALDHTSYSRSGFIMKTLGRVYDG